MSNVTNIVLLGQWDSHLEELNDWLKENGEQCLFRDLNDSNEPNTCDNRPFVAGSKALETTVLVGAFNHFPLEKFIEFLGSLKITSYDGCQMLYKKQDDVWFTTGFEKRGEQFA